jgi:hypothetical protein
VAAAAKGSRRQQGAMETKICQVIQAERQVPNLQCQLSVTVQHGTAVESCISIALHS